MPQIRIGGAFVWVGALLAPHRISLGPTFNYCGSSARNVGELALISAALICSQVTKVTTGNNRGKKSTFCHTLRKV